MEAHVLIALHLLSAVVWVGGMVFARLALRPSIAALGLGVLEPAQRVAVLMQVWRRFFLLVWHAMPILLITGEVMIFRVLGGYAHVGWPIHAMHALGDLMAVLFVFIFFVPWRAMRRAVAAGDAALAITSAERIFALTGVNLLLGLLTLLVAAFS